MRSTQPHAPPSSGHHGKAPGQTLFRKISEDGQGHRRVRPWPCPQLPSETRTALGRLRWQGSEWWC